MTANDIIKQVQLLPTIQVIPLDTQLKKDGIAEWVQPTVDEIAAAYEWDFVLGETTHSGGTVADQSQYTLIGNNDALEVITVKYDDDENVLVKMHPIDIDEYLHGRTHSAVSFWVPEGRVNNYPRIRIVATPGESSKQIKYRYRKKNITIQNLPDNFSRTVAIGVARNIVPGLEGSYQRSLEFMIDNYTATQVNERTARIDPALRDKNNYRHTKMGWS